MTEAFQWRIPELLLPASGVKVVHSTIACVLSHRLAVHPANLFCLLRDEQRRGDQHCDVLFGKARGRLLDQASRNERLACPSLQIHDDLQSLSDL